MSSTLVREWAASGVGVCNDRTGRGMLMGVELLTPEVEADDAGQARRRAYVPTDRFGASRLRRAALLLAHASHGLAALELVFP
jgi:hypothetical protein